MSVTCNNLIPTVVTDDLSGPTDLVDCLHVAPQHAHEPARPAVPQPDRLVEGGGRHEAGVRRELDVVHQLLQKMPCLHIAYRVLRL